MSLLQEGPPFNVASEPLLMDKPATSHCHHQLAHSTTLYHTVRDMLGIKTWHIEFRVVNATTEPQRRTTLLKTYT